MDETREATEDAGLDATKNAGRVAANDAGLNATDGTTNATAPAATPVIESWFQKRGWEPFAFQRRVWDHFLRGQHGLLNAPTGSGKTYALFLPALMDWIERNPKEYRERQENGLQLLWITPLKALAKDSEQAMKQVLEDLQIPWQVERRTGDVSQKVKAKQRIRLPEVLITTPESLHILLAQKDAARHFRHLKAVVVDEWHELIGSKRGTQMELGVSRLRGMRPDLRVWTISATIGNLEEALEFHPAAGAAHPDTGATPSSPVLVRAEQEKTILMETVIPEQMETFPWHGHLGIHLIDQILPILEQGRSTLLFTNTRAQSEIWFQQLLDRKPDLAGRIALHHGSLDKKIRDWVEASLHSGDVDVVVCTSSLDLGVDFSPVDQVIQVGSPKGVGRFLQRAGRSGHQPGAISRIWFVPTHALELIEAAALKDAVTDKQLEPRSPLIKPFDVLAQYLITLAVADGFEPDTIFEELKSTYAYRTLQPDEWSQMLDFIRFGGRSLSNYDDYQKVEIGEDGRWRVTNRRIARRHRMSIGTIASDAMLLVKFLKGGRLGRVEEWFISQLNPGDCFWFAGRNLELVMIKDMTVFVRKAKGASSKIPAYLGGRMSLSSNMSDRLREKLAEVHGLMGEPSAAEQNAPFHTSTPQSTDQLPSTGDASASTRTQDQDQHQTQDLPQTQHQIQAQIQHHTQKQDQTQSRTNFQPDIQPEMQSLLPLFQIQQKRSLLPGAGQFLIESSRSREGFHCFFYPFEGRYVHEGMSALIASRLSRLRPISFSIAMNDYGFELLSDQEIPIEEALASGLFSTDNLIRDLMGGLNDTELAKRRFRGISQIAGLVFSGFPGDRKTGKHLQVSSSLFFDVFMEYEPGHLLLQQAYDEVLRDQLDESRLRKVLERIGRQEIVLKKVDRFTPFAFPIFVDRIREKLSSETLLDRIQKMQRQLEA